jgi:Transposase, Mutator family
MRTPKAILIWEEVMPTLVGFGTFAALFEEQISEKISRRVLPRAARQRCLAHRMRNLASKIPEEVWPEFKARVQAAYQAPSRAIARELAAGVVADYGSKSWPRTDTVGDNAGARPAPAQGRLDITETGEI